MIRTPDPIQKICNVVFVRPLTMRCILFFLCFIVLVSARGQHYRFHQYRVEQGLPGDVIKAVTQDSLGFLWIATDDGLVKYDGLRFITYKDAFRSQYVKGFLHARDGRLLAFGDLDVIEIQNEIDTVVFKPLLKGERFLSDSAVWFPKAMYEDRSGMIWIAEPNSVVRFDGKTIRRYNFDESNRSPVFVRSFSFFEDDNNNIYAIAYNGSVFRYSSTADKFTSVKGERFPPDVSSVLWIEKRLLIAARSGLYSARISGERIVDMQNIFPIRHVSHLALTPDSSVLVSTYEQDLYRVRVSPELQWENLQYNFNGINHCFISNEKDIWVSSDKGLVLVQKNLFVLSDVASQTHFIEGITYDHQNDRIYYCTKESLIELTPYGENDWSRKVVHTGDQNYFQALEFGNGILWAASRGNVLQFVDGQLLNTWDFSLDGNFVHDVFLDKRGNLWVSQGGTAGIKVITDSMTIEQFSTRDLTQNDINLVREGDDGMYAIASGNTSYLLFKKHGDKAFQNISAPVPFFMRGDLNVVDMAIDPNNVIWLATSEGLLKYANGTIERVNFGDRFEEYPVSSVELLDRKNVLFSNSFGLFRYNVDLNEYWLYDENTGLPSNTITDHGIFVTPGKEVWIGTSYGVASSRGSLLQSAETRKPFCVDALVNGMPTRFRNGLVAEYGSFITLKFSPISFPENKISLQWKFSADSVWKNMDNQQLSFSGLDDGVYMLSVRAKKNTGYGWSEPNSLKLTVAPPYWKKTQFAMIVFSAVLIIAWASYGISSVLMNRRRKYLQAVINERTIELQKANEELRLRNSELDRFVYSASHDLSAPLKSILGLIRVAQMDNPGPAQEQYLGMMERSVHKLEDFIQEVVTYSRNVRMPVRYEAFVFREFVETLLLDHEYSPNFKSIRFIIEDELHGPMISDLTRMKIILNNLLSNAIKFHWIEEGREPFVKIHGRMAKGNYIISVIDNGKGISNAHITRIFEMFYRATDGTPGSGLGLYILKESVTKLGGTVSASSELEKGTTFDITLPIPSLEGSDSE